MSDSTQAQEDRVKAHLERRARTIRHMVEFSKIIKASDCAGISGQGDKVQFTHLHDSMKQKGGHAPKDYTAVEMLVDFKAALLQGKYDEAIPLYFGLRRMLGWDSR